MIQARRLSHLTLETPDLGRELDYYENIIGLSVVSKDPNEVHLATKLGQLSTVLKKGPAPRCAGLAFQVSPNADIADIEKNIAREGLNCSAISDPYPGVEKTIAFDDPKGTRLELFSTAAFVDPREVIGVGPVKLGHVAFVVSDPKEMAEFYGRVLGFRVSDWVEDFFVFLRCGPDHHTVNFLQGSGAQRIHHVAFELRDAAHLNESCEVLGRNRLEILWGPVRHGPGHNMATYHRNPDQIIVELFTELDRMSDEELAHFDPKPWHRDRPQRPKVWRKNERRDIWGPQIPSNFL